MIHHASKGKDDCPSEIKNFLQVFSYWGGESEGIDRVFYCPDCGAYKQERYQNCKDGEPVEIEHTYLYASTRRW